MSLHSYYVSLNRKDLAEKAIVSKREKEASRAQKCREVASYHEDLARTSSKYRNLEDQRLLRHNKANEESRVKEKITADKREQLEIRRHRLAHFLAIENEQYMKELNEMQTKERETDPWNIAKLKEQIEDLQRKRKEGEQNDEEEQLKREASAAWSKRKGELEKMSLEKKQKEQERMKTFELEQLKASREAREVEIKQLEEQEEWSNFVQGKVLELSEAENESKKLKIEKQILLSHMENLLAFQQRRDLVRDLQKKGFQRIQALWQPKEKLRKMSSEVQHALDLDLKLLLSLGSMNNSVAEDTALALLNLGNVGEAKHKIEMQIALEKERELEIQQLFHEEASKLWDKRSEEWTMETIARDQIIEAVIKSLTNQIREKVESNLEQLQRFLHIKENCLKEIDDANENAKTKKKVLDDKMNYFSDKAKRLGEELVAYKKASC